MILSVLVVMCLLKGAFLQSNTGLVHVEPIQYVKAQVSNVNKSSIWNVFNEAGPQQISEVSLSLKSKLNNLLHNSRTDVIFAKGERIISKRLSSKEKLNDLTAFPYANTISLLGVSMTILFENFKNSVVSKSIGEILKGDDLESPIIADHKSQSFIDILNLIGSGSESLLASRTVIKSLHTNGKVALHFVKSILGTAADEAWMDALMAFGIETPLLDSGELQLTLNNIFHYSLTVLHDFHTMSEAPDMNIPLQDQRYLFGWWVNCPKTLDHCIFQNLPRDLIFSLSPTLRIYISPSFELILLISQATSKSATIEDVINIDRNIWNEIFVTIAAESDIGSSMLPEIDNGEPVEDVTAKTNEENKTNTISDVVHHVWPILIFIFWVVSSHIWVYWMFYCCWLAATRFSKRTHVLRPKTAIAK